MKRKLAYLLMALIVLFSCTREENGRPVEYGGDVSLRFATGNLQTTKAETPGNGSVPDGGGLYLDGSGNPDLVILIAVRLLNPLLRLILPPLHFRPETIWYMPLAILKACGP